MAILIRLWRGRGSGRVGRAQRAPPSRREGNGGARSARPTLHASVFGPRRHAVESAGRPPPTSFQLCLANSWPGNRPPGAVHSLVYVCAHWLFDNPTDIRRTLSGGLAMRGHGSKRCRASLVRSTPKGRCGKRCLTHFWTHPFEPGRCARRFLRHKTLCRKHLQRPIFCGVIKPLQDNGLQPLKPFDGRCVLWGERQTQSIVE